VLLHERNVAGKVSDIKRVVGVSAGISVGVSVGSGVSVGVSVGSGLSDVGTTVGSLNTMIN
jgi:hypothetical protein